MSSTKTVLVPIAQGSEEIEALTCVDVLRRASVEVTMAAVGSSKQVKLSRGVTVVADCLMTDCKGKEYDAIALPGGMPGATNLANDATLTGLLHAQAAAGRIVAAQCASPAVVLHKHGLLKGKRATAYPHPKFVGILPEQSCVAQRVVQDGTTLTSQGPATAMDFSLKLVEMLCGPGRAASVKKALLCL